MSGDAFARRLASGAIIEEPVALVAAHPDDETLWAGTAFPRLRNLTLIHLTDGAPEDPADASRKGYATRAAYAAARAAELDAAVAALGGCVRRIGYGLTDQAACRDMGDLARRLSRDLTGMAAVLTHPYEGGHPDHDAAAFAVSRALDRIEGGRPAHVEFACYQRHEGARVFGAFAVDPAHVAHRRPIPPAEAARLERALAAHASQADVFGAWRPEAEQWRAAPAYDFARPPAGGALYDEYGWALTASTWLLCADTADQALGRASVAAC